MNMVNAGEVAQVAIIERWQWWQEALKDPAKIGSDELQIHANEYQLGYYRCRRKDSPWEPVGIYPDEDGVVVGLRNGKPVSDIQELFLWACRHPISYEAYIKALEGGGFDDEPEKAPGLGHNSGEADPFDALRIEYLGEKEMALEFMKTPAKDFIGKPKEAKERADKIAIWCDRISSIKSKAKAFHKTEKQPWLDGGAAVDDRWRSLAHDRDGDTVALIADMRAYVAPILDWFKQQEIERQRKAREEAERIRHEAEKAERARIEAEREQAKKIADGISDTAEIAEHNARQEALRQASEEAAAKARQAEKDAEARKVSVGRTGARMTLRKEKIGIVTDYSKAAAALVAMKHPDMVETIDKLAQRAAKAGMPFDGMAVEEREVVR